MSEDSAKPVVDRRAVLTPGVGRSSTAAGALGLTVAIGDYIWTCLDAHALVTPERSLIIMLCTAIWPTIHLLHIILNKRLTKIADDNGVSNE